MTIDRILCAQCFRCADICYAESKRIVGRDLTPEALYEEINKDRPFYELYGGGVTFSGGEPLTHGAYLARIAKKCRDHKIHVMVESCGYAKYEEFEEALPYIDAMFMDVKHIDPARHRELTGADNALILENIRRIAGFGIPITIRTPIVPGYTDEKENIEGIARFAAEVSGIKEYELLAYHDFGKSKYKSLGRPYELAGVKPPTDDQMRLLTKYANQIAKKSKIECFWMKNNKREVIK